MLSEKTIEAYRAMTIEERWKLVEELSTIAWRALLELPFEERERRLEIARKQHREGNDRIIEFLRSRG